MMNAAIRRLTDDGGVALLTVLGVVVIITILATTSFFLAQQALHESEMVEDESQAFRAANSGLDQVLTVFSEDTTGFPLYGSTPDGSYVIDLVDLGGGEYRLDSMGTGSDGTTETVSQQFFYMNLWKMNFAGTGPQSLISGSGGLAGTSNIIGPFYMKGNLNIANNMSVIEGPLFVKGGNINVGSSGSLGYDAEYIKVYCDGTVPENYSKGNAGGVFVSSISRSVPEITLPELTQEELEQWATKAQAESVDNLMGSRAPQGANLETSDGQPTSYPTMQPPSDGVWIRQKAHATNANYKFIGAADGTISSKGSGVTGLVIGGRTFGSWGPLTTTDGVSLPGDGHYTLANAHDDFAYDDVNNILYIEGTVFVDGPVTFNEDIRYVGNGSIVANGEIAINGYLRPYGTNAQGENNEWALGLVTPNDIHVYASANNAYGTFTARDSTPTLAGAFYAEGVVHFYHNVLMRGSVIAGRIDSDHPNMCLVTNPLLPTYLPQSLPGVDTGLLMPGLWTRR